MYKICFIAKRASASRFLEETGFPNSDERQKTSGTYLIGQNKRLLHPKEKYASNSVVIDLLKKMVRSSALLFFSKFIGNVGDYREKLSPCITNVWWQVSYRFLYSFVQICRKKLLHRLGVVPDCWSPVRALLDWLTTVFINLYAVSNTFGPF